MGWCVWEGVQALGWFVGWKETGSCMTNSGSKVFGRGQEASKDP